MKIEVDDRMRRRKKRMKKIILFLSVFIVFFFTIAYAGLKETNHIEGSTQISNYHIDFDYTGSVQEFVVPKDGLYKIECWGASGGRSSGDFIHNNGAYTSGEITLKKGEKLYIYVGQEGIAGAIKYNSSETSNAKATFNGGGAGGTAGGPYNNGTLYYYHHGMSGGGATDIRLVSGDWDSFASLKSRIMVAAGGAGDSHDYSKPSAGGTLQGLIGDGIDGSESESGNDWTSKRGEVGTQTSGYAFGKGGPGEDAPKDFCHGQIGGGGGYYGGTGSKASDGDCYLNAAGGGSSFISGYPGCNAIQESSTEANIIHTGQPNHYSGKIFTNSHMIDGASIMPNPQGDGTIIGNEGNGYARITYIH